MKRLRRGLCICLCVLFVLAFAGAAFAGEAPSQSTKEEIKEEVSGSLSTPLPVAIEPQLEIKQTTEPESITTEKSQPSGIQEAAPPAPSLIQPVQEEVGEKNEQALLVENEVPSIVPSVPPGGNINPNTSITFSSDDPLYEVRYTKDGTDPTGSSTLGSVPFDSSSAPFIQIKTALFGSGVKVVGSEREFCYTWSTNYMTQFAMQEEVVSENRGDVGGWFLAEYENQPLLDRTTRTLPGYYEYVAPAEGVVSSFCLRTDEAVGLQGMKNPAFSFWIHHEQDVSGDEAGKEIYVEIVRMKANGTAEEGSRVGPSISSKQPEGGWQEYFIDLSDYKEQSILWRIGVQGTHNVVLDDIKIVDMELAPVVKTMSTEEPYEDTTIMLEAEAGATVYYNEHENYFVGNGTDTALNAGQVFLPILENEQKGLYYYAEKIV